MHDIGNSFLLSLAMAIEVGSVSRCTPALELVTGDATKNRPDERPYRLGQPVYGVRLYCWLIKLKAPRLRNLEPQIGEPMRSQKQNYEFLNTYYIGIDVHKKSWKVAIRHDSRHLRNLSMDPSAEQLHSFMQRCYGPGRYMTMYEAGFTGFSTHRALQAQGFISRVDHASDVPSNDREKRRKTDKVDAGKLAWFNEEYECRPESWYNQQVSIVYTPSAEAEAYRDMWRRRDQLIGNQTRIKNRIRSYLHKWGIELPTSDNMKPWSGKFVELFKNLEFDQRGCRATLDSMLEELAAIQHQIRQTNTHLRDFSCQQGSWPIIEALQRNIAGVGHITATGFYAEIIDAGRFANENQLASYLGLAPDIHQSDDTYQPSGVTRRCNDRVRRLLIEAAWVAIRKNPHMRSLWNNYIRRMKKNKAIIRIARKLAAQMRRIWLDHQHGCSQAA